MFAIEIVLLLKDFLERYSSGLPSKEDLKSAIERRPSKGLLYKETFQFYRKKKNYSVEIQNSTETKSTERISLKSTIE